MTSKESYLIEATRLDVAIRQLSTSIDLFFSDGDEFSIYSLTRSAEEIISVLLKKRKIKSLWIQTLDDVIKPEYREEIRKLPDDLRNDLKHLRGKEDEIIRMNNLLNVYFILVCVEALFSNFPEQFKKCKQAVIFNVWIQLHYPSWFKKRLDLGRFTKGRSLSKRDFYKKHQRIFQDLVDMKFFENL